MIQIGELIQGYEIVINSKSKVVVGCNPKAPEPWVVWNVDRAGDTYNGSYCLDLNTAINEFFSRLH